MMTVPTEWKNNPVMFQSPPTSKPTPLTSPHFSIPTTSRRSLLDLTYSVARGDTEKTFGNRETKMTMASYKGITIFAIRKIFYFRCSKSVQILFLIPPCEHQPF